MNIPNYFKLAKLVSAHSNFKQRYKMGAVIVKNKSTISLGFNQLKSHPIYSNGIKFFSIHAEMSALIKSPIDVYGCSIYIYRQTMDDMPAMAKPCKNCLPYLIENGISEIYYTIPTYPYWKMEKI